MQDSFAKERVVDKHMKINSQVSEIHSNIGDLKEFTRMGNGVRLRQLEERSTFRTLSPT